MDGHNAQGEPLETNIFESDRGQLLGQHFCTRKILNTFQEVFISRRISAGRDPTDHGYAESHVAEVQLVEPGPSDVGCLQYYQSSTGTKDPQRLPHYLSPGAYLQSDRNGIKVDACVPERGHGMCVEHSQIDRSSLILQSLMCKGQHLRTDIRSDDVPSASVCPLIQHTQDNIAGAGGAIQHLEPGFAGNHRGDSSFPNPVDPKTEQIAK